MKTTKKQEFIKRDFIDYIFDLPIIDLKTKNEICRRYIWDIKTAIERVTEARSSI